MAEELLVIVALLGIGLAGAGWLAHRLNLPPALGYLAIGMAFAPTVQFSPDLPPDLFARAAEVGVLFVLFYIGLELDLKNLRAAMARTSLTLPFDILVPGLAGFLLARLVGWAPREAAVLGLCICLSSTLFGERLASGPGYPGEARRRTLGILVSEDVAAAALLATVAVLGEGGGGGSWLDPLAALARLVFLFILLTAGALLVMPRLLDAVARRHSNELLVLAGVGLVVAFGAAGLWAGSAELGALMAGVAAAEAGSRFVVRNAVQSLRDLALAVFFVTVGLTVDLAAIANHLGLVFAVAGIFLVGKLLVHIPASLGAGLKGDAALRTGLSLATMGEFSLILAAAALASGVAHPMLATTIVGAMLVLLLVVPMLVAAVPLILRVAERVPARTRQNVTFFFESVRTTQEPDEADPSRRRIAIRLFASNLILVAAWALLSTWGAPLVAARIPFHPLVSAALVFGLAVAIAAPLLYRAYRSYRDLVRLLVGVGDEADGARRVRARLVDAWVTLTTALLLIPVTLILPSALPVLAGGLLLAVVILVVAWRQLAGFQRALERTVTRVLGHDPQAGALLDQVLRNYPWGVRFAAVTVGPDSPMAGSTLSGSRIHELTECIVAVLQRGRKEIVNPAPDQDIQAGDTLVLMGDATQLAKAEALVVAHGEALRTQVQSRLAEVVEVPVHATSLLRGRTLGFADLRATTGALVVGVWPHGAQHPLPFAPNIVLDAEDHLILLGTPLQVERARLLAGESSDSHRAAAASA